MIVPHDDLKVLTQRPAVEIGWPVLFCGRYLRRILKPWHARVQQRQIQKLNELLNNVEKCQSRVELEALIGPPKYGLVGCFEIRPTTASLRSGDRAVTY